MKKWLLALCAAVSLVVGAVGVGQTQTLASYASGTITGGGSVTVDLHGESTCRISVTNPSSFTASLFAKLESVGDTTFQTVGVFDDAGVYHANNTALSVPNYYTAYPRSGGTIGVFATAGSGTVTVSISCSPAGAPPAPRDSAGNLPVDVASAAPGIFPSPIPYTSASPLPVNVLSLVPNSAFVSGSLSSTGVIAADPITGPSTCRFSLSGTWVGTVKAKEEAVGSLSFMQIPAWNDTNIQYSSGVTANGDYLVYPQSAGVIEISVTTYTSGTVVLSGLNCSPASGGHPNTDAQGNQTVTFPSAQPVTFPSAQPVTFPSAQPVNIMSPAPGTTPIPYQSYAGNVLKAILTDTGGTAYTPASPQPVTTPVPPAYAVSPAPANVIAQGYSASGATSPVICLHSAVAAITTSAAQLVAGSAGQQIYVCSFIVTIYGSAAGLVHFEYASSSCSTPAIVSSYDFVGSATVPTVLAAGVGVGLILAPIPAANNLCVVGTGTITAGHAQVMYEKF